MKIGVLALTTSGRQLAERIATRLPDCRVIRIEQGIAATLRENWREFDGFVTIMAAGITIRAIAPLLQDKTSDPAVVGLDRSVPRQLTLANQVVGST